ncbi:hypothetical protein DVH24_027168 [Malus domestica]|uniref:Uncharacterized protein n=1 Tax=Malus domestica TaxID=3750 RepID=A0A498IM21_MALDO|nr:hypothetical protein DVH24_027168 [Malus domestica]
MVSCSRIAVPIVSFLSSSNDKPNSNHRATTQSNPNEQSVELNRTSLYWGTNGRYYWKDSSLDNRYYSRYSCDRFNRLGSSL